MINKISLSEPTGKAKQLVVFLHGYGSNKDDLISLSEVFKGVLPEALFVSPNAPYELDFVPGGYGWFSLDGVELDNVDKSMPKRTESEFLASIDELNKFIDMLLKEYDISEDNLYLIGFSQGATMSIYTALSRSVPVKAVIAYSGICFNTMKAVSNPGIIGLSHGKLDDVVPFKWHDKNISMLKNQNLNVKDLVVDGAYHEIPMEAVEFGKNIIKESL